MSSDSDDGARRFQRTGKRPQNGIAVGPQKRRRGTRSVESALKHAVEYAGGCASSSDDDDLGPGKGPVAAAAAEAAAAAAPATGTKRKGRPPKQAQAAAASTADDIASEEKQPMPQDKLTKSQERWIAQEVARERKPKKLQVAPDALPGSKKAIHAQALQRNAAAVELLERHDGKVRRRELLNVTRAHIVEETPTKGTASQDGPSPEAELRFRAVAGKGGGRGRKGGGGGGGGGAGDESGSDAEPNEAQVKDFEKDLESRCDRGSTDPRSAFSLRQVPPAEIRRLGAESFLGGRKDEAGLLLFDSERKVNLNFFLGTYHAMKVAQKKLAKDEDAMASFPEEDRALLRWLAKRARELKLVDAREMKIGKVTARRLEAARKKGNFSLLLPENRLDGLDGDHQSRREATAAVHLDFEFPERPAEDASRKVDVAAERARLRQQVHAREAAIATESNASLDLGAVKDALLAPTFSFDWEDKDAEEDEWGGLEVEVPEDISSRKESKRELFQATLRRSVSFQQAQHIRAPGSTQTSFSHSRSRSFENFDDAVAFHSSSSKSADGLVDPLSSRSALASRLRGPSAAGDEEDLAKTSSVDVQKGAGEDKGKDAEAETPGLPEATDVSVEGTEAPEDFSAQLAEAARPAKEGDGSEAIRLVAENSETAEATGTPNEMGAAGAEKDCEPQACMDEQEEPRGLEVDEITPTAMWGAPCRESFLSGEVAPVAPCAAPADPCAFEGEISPTAPLQAAAVSSSKPPPFIGEISPTMPFEPAGASSSKPFFGEISPTAPFEPRLTSLSAPTPAVIDASTVVPAAEPKETATRPAVEANAVSVAADDIAQDDSLEDPFFEGLPVQDPSAEPLDDTERQRAQKEMEWLRHRRQIELRENQARERQDRQAKRRQKAESRAHALGAATMSADERQRFDAMVAGAGAASKATGGAESGVELEGFFGAGLQRPASRPAIFARAKGA